MNEAMVLEARGLRRTFLQGPTRIDVLDGLDLQVARGDAIAVIGASGSGKSTLLHALGGLDTPDSGQVCWDGRDVYALDEPERARLRNAHVGFVYQFHHLLVEFSALENVALPLLIQGRGRREAAGRAEQLLERVGLQDRLRHRPGQLSGGERQRVAIARALATEPAVILADEPTGNLDRDTAGQVQQLLLELNSEQGVALVVVTHDLDLAGRLQRSTRLQHGRLVPLSGSRV